MTAAVNLDTLGMPVPLSWQVQQIRGSDGKMYAKLIMLTPVGVFAFLMDGNDAEILASNLRQAGRHAKAGIWTPEAPGQAQAPRPASGPPIPFSGAEPQ